eukprot:snap_masked-scaffold_12-processed-gene-11.39-mRNA-1 protein AED:1.00 eAED:1.00 QI:0/0/0/0/1/1/2/0/157
MQQFPFGNTWDTGEEETSGLLEDWFKEGSDVFQGKSPPETSIANLDHEDNATQEYTGEHRYRRWSAEAEMFLVGNYFDRKFVNISFRQKDWEIVHEGFTLDCRAYKVEDGLSRDLSAVKRHFKEMAVKNRLDNAYSFEAMHTMYKHRKGALGYLSLK